ncbi:MAG: 30S ribosomal protein S17 [Omnitrophica bacterium RIFCSPLOWO2_12_FULL_50_11]|nr:MAG: 30S ribosomal protein S17 [Omnitrophica bacterium RIFCSPLOWO2_12_FULL_50_11]
MAKRHRKELIGVVLSDKMNKSAVVQVSRLVQHPIYKKVMKEQKKYVAHDEKNAARMGDKVRIRETRPISKTKRWRIVQVLSGNA